MTHIRWWVATSNKWVLMLIKSIDCHWFVRLHSDLSIFSVQNRLYLWISNFEYRSIGDRGKWCRRTGKILSNQNLISRGGIEKQWAKLDFRQKLKKWTQQRNVGHISVFSEQQKMWKKRQQATIVRDYFWHPGEIVGSQANQRVSTLPLSMAQVPWATEKYFSAVSTRHSSHFNDLSIKIPIFSVHNKSVVTRVTIKRPIERPVVHHFAFQVVCCLAPHFSSWNEPNCRACTHTHTRAHEPTTYRDTHMARCESHPIHSEIYHRSLISANEPCDCNFFVGLFCIN